MTRSWWLLLASSLALGGLIYGTPAPKPEPVAPALETAQRCPCPAPEGTCFVPCVACCDDTTTPEVEQCPCDPTCHP